ncbi:MAG: CapA family protein [Candidatus Doudnabacteria bacterium]|nr:CapA family protein [Candidatus Doudnabacteria bacterium]
MQYNWYKILAGTAVVLIAGASVLFLKYKVPDNFTLPPIYRMEEEPQPKITKLFFAGDIMLSRNVGTKIYEANDPLLPYKNIREWVLNADIAFANLESPFNNEGARITQGLIFKAEPGSITGLKDSGFDILSTANNHTMDQGIGGLNFTMNWLKSNGIDYIGTGSDCHDGLIKETNGIKFGYLAYSYTAYNDGGKIPDPLVCNWTDSKQISADIMLLKPMVDFLIVSSHMGVEYKRSPEQSNASGARTAIDAGADLFIGHHPHWIQTIEEYRGKYIFYSLGNFVFDQMWSQDTTEGLSIEVLFKDKNLSRITLLPVVIENFCCPRPATDTETKSILGKINPQASTFLLVENGQTTTSWKAALSNKGSLIAPDKLDNSAIVE